MRAGGIGKIGEAKNLQSEIRDDAFFGLAGGHATHNRGQQP